MKSFEKLSNLMEMGDVTGLEGQLGPPGDLVDYGLAVDHADTPETNPNPNKRHGVASA